MKYLCMYVTFLIFVESFIDISRRFPGSMVGEGRIGPLFVQLEVSLFRLCWFPAVFPGFLSLCVFVMADFDVLDTCVSS